METHTLMSPATHSPSPTYHDNETHYSPRPSTDSQTRLLPPPSLDILPARHRRAQSYAPSINSILSSSTITLTPSNHQQRGFRSRESYLAALNEFEESKMYMEETQYTLRGLYGQTTMDEYRAKLGPTLREQRRRRKEIEAREKERVRRERERKLDGVEKNGSQEELVSAAEVRKGVPPEDEQDRKEMQGGTLKESRMRRLSRVLIGARRNTVS